MKQNKLDHRAVKLAIFFAALLLSGAPQANSQQTQKQVRSPHSTTQVRPGLRPAFNLRVSSTNSLRLITLQAKNASLQEVAAELERQLKAQVIVSSAISQQRLTLNFRDLNLETALRLLAPQVYVDYELGGEAATAQPRPISIYLHAQDEAAPSIFGTVKISSETFMLEGDTDEVGKAPVSSTNSEGDKSLRVNFEKERLSVLARKQPLAVVLYMVANKVGIPFSLRSDSRALIDVDFSEITLEEGMRKLSTDARLYVRTNLQTSQTRPLRLIFESK